MKQKWESLQHNGPSFPEDYKLRNYKVFVSGKEVTLSLLGEEMAYHWAAKLQTKYVKDEVFQKNFWSDFKKQLTPELQETSFPADWDFSSFYNSIQIEKEQKKIKAKENKKKEKEDKENRKKFYGTAILNGKEVELGNYIVEPAGIFMGRGEHPARGKWKIKANPEDVILNLSKGSKIPDAPIGHKWKGVVENKGALWAAMWYENITGAQKRILFSVNSFIRQSADQKKFDKAAKLAKNYDKVTDFIEKKLCSREKITRELATVSYLIAKLCIRVGDEKDTDTAADTVGATSLRKEHIKVEGTSIILDFLGKDSVRYYNKVSDLNINAIRNIEEFLEGKIVGEQLFSNTSSHDVNEFLGTALTGLTAKQFRTAIGSTLLSKSLRKQNIIADMKDSKKLELFTEANLEVALKLNHQNTVSEAYDESIVKMKLNLESLKNELVALKKESQSLITKSTLDKDERIAFAQEKWTGDRLTAAIKRAEEKCECDVSRIDNRTTKLNERITSLDTKIKIKEKTRGCALGTSKGAYVDPRIIVSWCKDNNVDLKRIYAQTAQNKFSWAMSANKDFYKNYPI